MCYHNTPEHYYKVILSGGDRVINLCLGCFNCCQAKFLEDLEDEIEVKLVKGNVVCECGLRKFLKGVKGFEEEKKREEGRTVMSECIIEGVGEIEDLGNHEVSSDNLEMLMTKKRSSKIQQEVFDSPKRLLSHRTKKNPNPLEEDLIPHSASFNQVPISPSQSNKILKTQVPDPNLLSEPSEDLQSSLSIRTDLQESSTNQVPTYIKPQDLALDLEDPENSQIDVFSETSSENDLIPSTPLTNPQKVILMSINSPPQPPSQPLWKEFTDHPTEINSLSLFLEDLIQAYPIRGIDHSHLFQFDEHLEKVVHLYELLCQGYITPAYLRLMNNKKKEINSSEIFIKGFLEEIQGGERKRMYTFMSACFALIFGDFGEFIKHSGLFCEEIFMRGQKGRAACDIAVQGMMMVHDSEFYRGSSSDGQMNVLHHEIFRKLFLDKAKDAKYIHSILSSRQRFVYDMVKNFDIEDSKDKFGSGILRRRREFKKFLVDKLHFDEDSCEWLKTLLCIILGNTDRVSFIGAQYEISSSMFEILQSICSRSISKMVPLFKSIDSNTDAEINTEMCIVRARLLRGDFGSALYILKYGQQEIEKTLSNHKGFNSLVTEHTSLCNFIISDNFVTESDFLNLIINNQELEGELVELGELDILIPALRVIEGTCTTEEIRKVLEVKNRGITKEELKRKDSFERDIRNQNYDDLKRFIGALNGDIMDFGFICDKLFFGDQNWLCSLLTSIACRKSEFCMRENGDLRGILEIHLRALLKTFYPEVRGDNEDLISTFAYILGSSLFKKNPDLKSLLPIKSVLTSQGYIDPENYSVIETLLTKREVPDLSNFMKNINLEVSPKEENKDDTDFNDFVEINRFVATNDFSKKLFKIHPAKPLPEPLSENESEFESDSEEEKTTEPKKGEEPSLINPEPCDPTNQPKSPLDKSSYKILPDQKGIKIKKSKLLEIMLKISNQQPESLSHLILLLKPCFSNIYEYSLILDLCNILIKEKNKEFEEDSEEDISDKDINKEEENKEEKNRESILNKLPQIVDLFRLVARNRNRSEEVFIGGSEKQDMEKVTSLEKVISKSSPVGGAAKKKSSAMGGTVNVFIEETILENEKGEDDSCSEIMGEEEGEKDKKAKKEKTKKELEDIDNQVAESVSGMLKYFSSNIRRDKEFSVIGNLKDFHEALLSINKGLVASGQEPIGTKNQEQLLAFIVGICTEDFDMLFTVASNFGMYNNKKIKAFINIFKKFQTILYGKQIYGMPELQKDMKRGIGSVKRAFKDSKLNLRGAVKMIAQEGAEEVEKGAQKTKKEIKQRASNISDFAMATTGNYITEIVYKDLFTMFDRDCTGLISYKEFQDLCKYMGLQLNPERTLKLFSKADINGNNYIDEEEFGKAMVLIKMEIAKNSLRELGLTSDDLIIFGVMSIISLILSLAFIFLGIFAFSRADSFNAVINSLLPIAAGLGTASQSINVSERASKVKDHVSDFFEKMTKKEE